MNERLVFDHTHGVRYLPSLPSHCELKIENYKEFPETDPSRILHVGLTILHRINVRSRDHEPELAGSLVPRSGSTGLPRRSSGASTEAAPWACRVASVLTARVVVGPSRPATDVTQPVGSRPRGACRLDRSMDRSARGTGKPTCSRIDRPSHLGACGRIMAP